LHSKPTPLPVLQEFQRRDSENEQWISGSMSELWSDGAKAEQPMLREEASEFFQPHRSEIRNPDKAVRAYFEK
jgi:hypothetical protein